MKERIGQKNPLVLDADGSLLATDMLFECFWAALGKTPLACLKAAIFNLHNIAKLKQEMAILAALDVTSMPVRPEVLALCDAAKSDNRTVIIASGSDRSLVAELSKSIGLGDDFMASDGRVNLTSTRKSDALLARFGVKKFDYVGDSSADIAVWKNADQAIAVVPRTRLLAKIGREVQIIGTPTRAKDILRAFRPHQWVKNILLFLPLLAAHRTDLAGVMLVLWGIVAFSAAASSIYIINDLLDLSADRKHKTKHKRPFASGAVPIQTGMLASFALAAFALIVSGLHGWPLLAIVAVYMVLSLSYSLVLKRLRWVDVTALAALYTLRVVAGSLAVGVEMSGWLAVFIFPVFLSLGCVKRLVELSKAENDQILPGRGYAKRDRGDLLNIAITAAVGAIVVFGLYSYSEIAQVLYQTPLELRLAGVAVAVWLARMIQLGWQGCMDYDPIVFALRDPIGLVLIAMGAVLLFHAAS